MRKTEYDIPIFDDEDEADLNKYSELIAELLKKQLDCFYEKETARQGDEEKRKSAELLREKSEEERTSNEKKREESETLREEYAKTLKGIRSIELVKGTHKSGELDTYRITYTDNSSKDIQIYNGKDGKGSGDMQKSVYDTNDDGIVEEADHAKNADTAINATKVNNHTVEKDVPSNAMFTDTTYSKATTEQDGLMSSEDKKKLDEITKTILKLVFPIGSRYVTQTSEENPADILGIGTWERFDGKLCIGLDEEDEDFNEIGKTGGNKQHQHWLPIAIDSPTGNWGKLQWNYNFGYGYQTISTPNYLSLNASPIPSEETLYQLRSCNEKNIQPYEVVGYMWIRRK